jgi:hypothetical protein
MTWARKEVIRRKTSSISQIWQENAEAKARRIDDKIAKRCAKKILEMRDRNQ